MYTSPPGRAKAARRPFVALLATVAIVAFRTVFSIPLYPKPCRDARLAGNALDP